MDSWNVFLFCLAPIWKCIYTFRNDSNQFTFIHWQCNQKKLFGVNLVSIFIKLMFIISHFTLQIIIQIHITLYCCPKQLRMYFNYFALQQLFCFYISIYKKKKIVPGVYRNNQALHIKGKKNKQIFSPFSFSTIASKFSSRMQYKNPQIINLETN